MRELNTHRFADIFPQMTNDEWEAFLADIDANGVQVPLVLYQGDILDGRHRYQAAQTLFERKGADIPFDTLDFEGEESDALRFVYSVNMHRRHLTTGQRACIGVEIKRNLQETVKPGRPPNSGNNSSEFGGINTGKEAAEMAAEIVSVGKSAIYITEKIAEHAADLYEEMRAGNLSVHAAENKLAVRQGTQTPRQAAAAIAKEIVATVGAENVTETQLRKVTNALTYEPHIKNNTGESEWYTPPSVLCLVRQVLGEIELDPASCAQANEAVQAKAFYTQEQEGLEQEWRGKVFLNPPYSMPHIADFMEKLRIHFLSGEVTGAITLTNNATETDWFQRTARIASAICFPDGRISFVSPSGELGKPLQGQAILYLGDNPSLFCSVFGELGLVLRSA